MLYSRHVSVNIVILKHFWCIFLRFSTPEIYGDVIGFLLQNKGYHDFVEEKTLVNFFFLQERDAIMFFIENCLGKKKRDLVEFVFRIYCI